jgi:hypothetical protein
MFLRHPKCDILPFWSNVGRPTMANMWNFASHGHFIVQKPFKTHFLCSLKYFLNQKCFYIFSRTGNDGHFQALKKVVRHRQIFNHIFNANLLDDIVKTPAVLLQKYAKNLCNLCSKCLYYMDNVFYIFRLLCK